MVQNNDFDTIVAQATPRGFGGIGIVRVSGPLVPDIAKALLKKCPAQKQAEYLNFIDQDNEVVDQGIALYFKAPHSFTGEDVLELQGHGGPMVIQRVVREVMRLGARHARAGEFSERAFLNNKIDLLQAEAILELIHATSETAAKSAIRSLQGEFSTAIQSLVDGLIQLRMQVEAEIDFPEEDIQEQTDAKMISVLNDLKLELESILRKAKTGSLLSEGAKIVILGRPNAGKSSLLNALSGVDAAIVTEIPGTTRDLLRETICLDGLLLHLVDTAGLRQSEDAVEQEGIKRAVNEMSCADHIILMVDATINQEKDLKLLFPEWMDQLPKDTPITVLYNKIDTLNIKPRVEKSELDLNLTQVWISVKTRAGLDLLSEHLKTSFQFYIGEEGVFAARSRHTNALETAVVHLDVAKQQLKVGKSLELMAEELRLSQKQLDEITGKFSSDDLLGKIFSEFCIGK